MCPLEDMTALKASRKTVQGRVPSEKEESKSVFNHCSGQSQFFFFPLFFPFFLASSEVGSRVFFFSPFFSLFVLANSEVTSKFGYNPKSHVGEYMKISFIFVLIHPNFSNFIDFV